MAVRVRARHRIEADVAVAAGAVLDHERLAERLLHSRSEHAHGDVRHAAGGDVDDHAHRLAGPGLRLAGERKECADDQQESHFRNSLSTELNPSGFWMLAICAARGTDKWRAPSIFNDKRSISGGGPPSWSSAPLT
ncbi:hypothetical protein D3C83_41070 [compost metagenome]